MNGLSGSEVICSNDSLSRLDKMLNKQFSTFSKVIIADTNTHKCCLDVLIKNCPALKPATVIIIKSGERHKTIGTVQEIWKQMINTGIGRNTIVINLGGGVVTDTGGFAASIYMRGLTYINIPTTLLAMVDAAIGGKTGIDFSGYKNLIGTFAMPYAVCVYLPFLKTLNQAEIKNGFAEIIKSALIADAALFKKIERNDLSKNITYGLINKVEGIKTRLVESDLKDTGERKKLNLGHTIGHAIEALLLSKRKPVSHGHAVAMGLIYESVLAVSKKMLSVSDLKRVEALLSQYFTVIQFGNKDQRKLLKYMKLDKKNKVGNIYFTLLQKPGRALINQMAGEEEILQALNYYRNKIIN